VTQKIIVYVEGISLEICFVNSRNNASPSLQLTQWLMNYKNNGKTSY